MARFGGVDVAAVLAKTLSSVFPNGVAGRSRLAVSVVFIVTVAKTVMPNTAEVISVVRPVRIKTTTVAENSIGGANRIFVNVVGSGVVSVQEGRVRSKGAAHMTRQRFARFRTVVREGGRRGGAKEAGSAERRNTSKGRDVNSTIGADRM